MKSLFILCLAFTIVFVYADTEVSGNVAGTWALAGSPYIVTGNLVVQDGDSLVVENDVQVIFNDNYLFTIEGTLIATYADFELTDTPPAGVFSWNGLYFEDTSGDCVVDNCNFDNAAPAIVFDNTSIFNFPSDPEITNSYFEYLYYDSLDAEFGMKLFGKTSPKIDNCDIVSYNKGIYISNETDEESDPTISNTRIRSNPNTRRQENYALKIIGKASVDIDSCEIVDFEHGILFSGDADPIMTMPTITNTDFIIDPDTSPPPLMDTGIFIDSLVSIEINSCLVEGYDYGIKLLNTSTEESEPTIANTRIRSNPNTRTINVGLFMSGNMNSNIITNRFVDCDSAVVITGNDTYSFLNDNSIAVTDTTNRTGIVAIHATDSDSLFIYNTTIYYYDTGLYSDSTGMDFQNNIVWHGSPNDELIDCDTTQVNISYNNIRSPGNLSFGGLHNIDVDPLFYNPNPAEACFRLQSGSPCIGAGNPDPNFNDPDGTRNDMGAFYYGGQYPCPVTLSSFNAVCVNGSSLLQWTTQSETMNQGWHIYRGDSVNDFLEDEVLQINPRLVPGYGTTSEPHDYEYKDEYELIADNEYWYWLECVDFSGSTNLFGPVALTIPGEEEPGELPIQTLLIGNFPNPFKPSTKIKFEVQKDKQAILSIYNIKGQLVDKFEYSAGYIDHEWNAEKYCSGIYFYKLESDNFSKIKKMILLR